MFEMKQVVFKLLRQGVSMSQIITTMEELKQELLTMEDYAKAIRDADFRP